MTGLEAVTFDYWNTLLAERPGGRSRVDAWMGVFEGEGVALERESVDAAFASNWETFQRHWEANLVYGARETVDHVLERLGLDPPADVRRGLVETVADPPGRHDPTPTEHIEGCLRALKDAGLRIGIICDVGLTPSTILRRFLDQYGLLGFFDHWSFSDEVGIFKPDARIFHHALDGLGVSDPAAAAHIGDLRRTDVAGARALGITSVRYNGVFDDPMPEDTVVEADHVVSDHADLPALLGIAS